MARTDVNKSFGKPSSNNMIKFLSNSYQTGKEYQSKKFRKKWFDSAKDMYCKDLVAHFGCVNSVEFSNDSDDLLFSGGDDRRILLWKVGEAIFDDCHPVPMKTIHYSNIFCLAVDSFNRRIFSGSNDDQVLLHDYTTGNLSDSFLQDSPVFSISLQPGNSCVFSTASENGRVLLYDTRKSEADPLCIAQLAHPFHGVMFHPLEDKLIATANSQMGIDVWDIRKPQEALRHCCSEQGMAVRWKSDGSSLLCIRNQLPPLLVDPVNDVKLAEFDADSYYNACTMKSCCFAGENEEYVVSGSDDFNVHMWKIPEPWPKKMVSGAHLTLRGHRSIVNQVRYSPQRQLIVSSGVEKVIKLWSPYPMPHASGGRDEVRKARGRLICSANMCRPSRTYLQGDGGTENTHEDQGMLHFFDSLLRNEFKDSSSSAPRIPGSYVPQYNCFLAQKKSLLLRTLIEPEPFICSLRNDTSVLDDLLGSSVSSGAMSPFLNSSDSPSSTSSANSGSSTPVFPRGSSDSDSSSTTSDDEPKVIRIIRNRNYAIRRQRRSHSSSDVEDV